MFLLKTFYELLIASVAFEVVRGLIFDRPCVAPSPCICSLQYVLCNNKNLTTIPTFTQNSEHYHGVFLELKKNQLTTVPANAFKILSHTGAAEFNIDLSNNRLTLIDMHAFDGIASVVVHLNLDFNDFTHLPSVLRNLTALTHLLIHDNPLTILDAGIMASLGGTLQVFSISDDNLTSPPNELQNLVHLTDLSIYSKFNNTSTGHILNAITKLPKLNYLYLSGNPLDCSCSGMANLKAWNVTSIHVRATCSTGGNAETYLRTILPKCP